MRGVEAVFHPFLTFALQEGERSAKKRPPTRIMYWPAVSTRLAVGTVSHAGRWSNTKGDNWKRHDVGGEVITRLQGSNTNYCDWRVITACGLSMRILGNYSVRDLSSLILDSVRIADISTSRGLFPDKQVGRERGGGERGSIRKLHWSYCLEAKKKNQEKTQLRAQFVWANKLKQNTAIVLFISPK